MSLREVRIIAALFLIAGCSNGSPGVLSPSRSQEPVTHSSSSNYPTDKPLLFVADEPDAAVDIYRAGALPNNPSPLAVIETQVGCPGQMAVDAAGTLYVPDACFGSDVEEFPKGSTMLQTAITDGISSPQAVAVDAHGNLFVANHPAAITEYALGSTSPFETFSGGGMKSPSDLTVDTKSNLYIADPEAGKVFKVKSGYFTIERLNLKDLVQPYGVAIDDKTGFLWVTDIKQNVVNVYDLAKSTTPIETISGYGNPQAIDVLGKIAVADLNTDAVYLYKPKQQTPYATLTKGFTLPGGVLLTQP